MVLNVGLNVCPIDVVSYRSGDMVLNVVSCRYNESGRGGRIETARKIQSKWVNADSLLN